jgi:hypothetical protein
VLKKVQNTATADNGSGSAHSGWLCTYYIYDDYDNLRCVVQPRGTELLDGNWDLSNATILAEQCFRYEYDQRNRMIMKKVPGSAEVYMVYDVRDRLVMTQDGNMRPGGNWLTTVYDDLDRPVQTSYSGSAGTPLSVTHYDDYGSLPALSDLYNSSWDGNFKSTDNNTWPYPQKPAKSTATKGLPTWTQAAVLSPSGIGALLTAVTLYDVKGRPIQVQSQNVTGGTNVVTTQYTWAGQALTTVQSEQKSGNNAQTTVISTSTAYDDLGRPLQVQELLSNSLVGAMPAPRLVSSLQYDASWAIEKQNPWQRAGNACLRLQYPRMAAGGEQELCIGRFLRSRAGLQRGHDNAAAGTLYGAFFRV